MPSTSQRTRRQYATRSVRGAKDAGIRPGANMTATNDRPAIAPTALDHVALWVADRDALAAFLCDHLGMHEIDRTGSFTLVGADARRGKITLSAPGGPRAP